MTRAASLVGRRPSLFGALPDELAGLGNAPAHVFGVAQRVSSWREGAPAPGAPLARKISQRFDAVPPAVVAARRGADGATRFSLRLGDGAVVEAVHMPRDVAAPRVTLCLSSQVGCGMGCAFCATATMGLVRNLEAGEIVGQALVLLDALGPREHGRTSIVLMGMGEPLQNLREVGRALEVLTDTRGLGIPATRITLSTSGLVPQLGALAALPVRPLLAVSLNATTDEARAALMPVGKTHGLAALRHALATYPLRPRERITLEYVLLSGVNDSLDDAERLAELARGVPHVLNVIPFNAWEGSGFARADDRTCAAFVGALKARGCFVTVRRSRGPEVAAACGQLAREPAACGVPEGPRA